MAQGSKIGSIGWHDITVPNAPELRDFYSAVVGWKPEDVDMGEYADFNMTQPDTGEPVAGVCHARGSNSGLPPQWLIYIIVADLDASVEACTAKGGTVIRDPQPLAGGRFAVIADPVGAVTALYQEP